MSYTALSIYSAHTPIKLRESAMIIDSDLTVKVGDGVAVFDEPTLRDWAIMIEMSGKTLEEQADILLPKLKELRGFEYKDGTAVTVEDLKNKKFSAKFFFQLIQAWSKAIVEGLKGEAESKNDVTVN